MRENKIPHCGATYVVTKCGESVYIRATSGKKERTHRKRHYTINASMKANKKKTMETLENAHHASVKKIKKYHSADEVKKNNCTGNKERYRKRNLIGIF